MFFKDRKAEIRDSIQSLIDQILNPPKENIEGILLLDHFNDKINSSKLGPFGSWNINPQDYTQYCFESFSPLTKRGPKGYALRIDYDVDSPQPAYNGIWFKLGEIDLSDYKYLVLWIKGDQERGFTRHFKIELKNSYGEKGIYYITDITSNWKEFIVPLNKLMGISRFDRMRELVFVFEDWRVTKKEGVIYVDDIYFSKGPIIKEPLCNIFKTIRERVPKPEIANLSDEEFLDLLQKKAFLYFWLETDPETGLVKDKADNFLDDTSTVATIAGVGFALSAYVVAAERGWLPKEKLYERTLKTLEFFKDKMENVRGFYYHFIDMKTGKRVWQSELSSIDTALFLAGALTAGEYFRGKIKKIAEELYRRVDWNWMLADGDTLAMGWYPEKGFDPNRWNRYGEQLILYLLAIGSPTYPIPASSWDRIRRPIWEYEGYVTISSPPLFTHQYSHIWIDFRNKHDKYADYFLSSRNATLANRKFCLDNKDNSITFRRGFWGLTACEGPGGYRAYGAPPGYANYDGTVAPTAAAGSIVFTPKESIELLRKIYQELADKLWGKYGFSDSFNLDKNWFSQYVLAIDQGPILLMIENYRTGLIWKYFMKNKYIRKALKLTGFKKGTSQLRIEPPAIVEAKKTFEMEYELSSEKNIEYGAITNASDLSVKFSAAWDYDNLYLRVEIKDNEVITEQIAEELYKDDCIEIYLDPQNDGFYWGNPSDFQFGFAPIFDTESLKYAWFQEKVFDEIKTETTKIASGYKMIITIPWKILNFQPKRGKEIAFSLAVHDRDSKDLTPEAKLNFYFIPYYQKGALSEFKLGKIILK